MKFAYGLGDACHSLGIGKFSLGSGEGLPGRSKFPKNSGVYFVFRV